MLNSGTLSCYDSPDILQFSGSAFPGAHGTGLFLDSTDLFFSSGIVISDSTRIYPDMTFVQELSLGEGRPFMRTWKNPNNHVFVLEVR